MSSSGYRGRSFGPRGARTNGPANGFNGPRFPHPSFNHPRLPHRLPGPDKWIERSNFVPWQQNKNFLPHPYRGSLQFRPNNRGRIAGSRGIIRFSGPGRPSAPQFCLSFIRNPIHRVPLPQEEQVEDKCILIPQTPLPGSEEERQQKISETADKLKQKLSSITEEELTNFWEDDLSVLPNNGSEEENIRNKGIPELRHEPPELDLTFTDFRDIGRVDCNNSKFENADNKSNDDISISFEQKSTDNIHSELSDFECNIEDLQLQDNNITKSLTSDLSDTNEKLPTLNLDGNKTNLLPIDSVNDSLSEKSSNINDIEITSMLVSTTNIKEKMTLYQMLTNDTLPGDNNLQKNNVMHENEEVETSLIRPRTPSVLMSQLIQNIETSPVSNPCPKTTTECLSVQDSPSNSIQTNKFKTLYKQNHHVGRKRNCTSICSSDDEEMHHPGDIKLTDSRKRKKQRTEKVIQKLENKLDGNITTKDTQNTVTEKKQVNDAIKLPCKNVNMRKATTEQESDQFLVNETKSQEDTNKTSIQEIDSLNNDKIETFKDQEVQKIIEPTESEIYVNKIVQTKIPEFNEENYITKNNGEDIETLNKRNNRLGSPEKLPESRASERSSIYSDDSTWDSILQNSSIDEQKKSNTGLALLEETYKKEMAKTRKIKAEARKEKKKKLQNLLEAVNILTADEEELPLSTLYIKKLHQKQMLLNSLEQQMKQEANEDPQHWKNVVEVINAVAENKTNELYPDSLEKQLIGGSESATFDKINLVEDSGPKENKEKQVVGSSTLKNIKEVCPELLTDVNISCEDKDKSNNNSEKDELLSGKLQKFLNNEFQRDLEINVSSKTVKDLPKTYVHDTFMNVKKNLVEFPVQKIIENDNIVIDQLTAIENSDSSLTESNSNNVHNDRNILNISENPDTEKTEGQSDMKSKESNLQDNLNLVNIEKNIATCKPTNSQLILTEDVLKSEDVGKNCDASIQSSNGKNTEIPSEIIPKTESESKLDNINEKKLQDSSVLYDKDNNVDNVTSEVNFMTENNHFISLKEHKRSCKRKEVDQFNKISSEENNNQNCASVSSVENIGTSKSDETLGRKPAKRKRGNSKTPLRRSSRYTEEPAKRIKLEADVTASNTEQEVQEKNFSIQLPSMVSTSVSPCAEVETILINPRISRDIQKPLINKKRCTPVFPEIEILADELNSNNESLKGIKRHKKHTMFEMMNCVVRVVDCKHTILNATA
ncbi:hypothetical protein WN48_02439, partial [Eufriesea mexicana]